jgi:DNA-binding transcriptional MerR regulator
MCIKTREAAKLLGVNETIFRVWVRKNLVPVRRMGTSHALFDPKKLLEWWRSVDEIPDTEESNIGRKAKAVQRINRKVQEIELAEWRKNRRQVELKEMEQSING